jgi:DNA-binding Lrp family transcriptional regulator
MKQLDSTDHKILYQLLLNSRQTFSKIGKNIHREKNIIRYRTEKMVERKVITNFNTIVDYLKLGYKIYRINSIFSYTSPQKEKEIIQYFRNSPYIWSLVSSKGKFDLIATILSKNPYNIYSFYEDLLKKYRFYFKEVNFTEIYEIHGYHSFLATNELKKDSGSYNLRFSPKISKLSSAEEMVLKLLSNNSRIKIVEIADKTNLSMPTVRKIIKSLIKQEIIRGFSINIDINKLKYKGFIVNCYLSSYANRYNIIKFISKIPFTWEICKTVGGADLEFSLFATNFEHFYREMENIRNKFPNDFIHYDYIVITDFHKNNVYQSH